MDTGKEGQNNTLFQGKISRDGDFHEMLGLMTEKCTDPDALFQTLLEQIRSYRPNVELSMIERAYDLAKCAHTEQLRKSGEVYIVHPLWTCMILAYLGMDKETITAAMLHDVVEDTIITAEEIQEKFGEDVALLVEGVTKLSQLSYSQDKFEVQAENLRKMFLAMAKDIRVILIKLADRLHNMRTLQYMTEQKRAEKARETMDIYAPIAGRLGISQIKIALDDLCLQYLEPKAYEALTEELKNRHTKREQFINEVVEQIRGYVEESRIPAKVYGRVKHVFSIYRKMKKQEKKLEEIYDVFAVRVVVNSVKDCYGVLGALHAVYKPIPGRFKDYIAMPKRNMYQSLHTTLLSEKGKPFEVQIRTWEMHKTAEYGIAAHWKYKESGGSEKQAQKNGAEVKLTWLRQVLEWQKESSDNREFLSLLKGDLDLFSDDVYCFTPGGDVKMLPSGSTPVDFAYSIHSAVGNTMVGARVNGRLVPIDFPLKNGDRVEILTSQNAKGPSRDWLKLVKSPMAKSKINQWFKKEFYEENLEKGKELLQAYSKLKGYDLEKLLKPTFMKVVTDKYGFRDWDSAMASVGRGGIKEGQVVNRLLQEYEKEHPPAPEIKKAMPATSPEEAKREIHSKSDVVVKGADNIAIHFSRCCNPLPGDEIVGFVTKGRGLSVHRTDCVNILCMTEAERERLLPVEWNHFAKKAQTHYQAEITMLIHDRSGLLMEWARVFTENHITVQSLYTKEKKGDKSFVEAVFLVENKEELTRLIAKLKQIEGVLEIKRS